MTTTEQDDVLRSVLATVAPGTWLRDGLERILRGNTGALIVIGWDRTVEMLCTGGFPLDVEFSATRLRELCKMDGAVVLSSDGERIVYAATHLMPDPATPTEESGTRHRTAQRMARQTGFPVISVSQSMRIISLYIGERRYVLEGTGELLTRANQAINTLERYKSRLDEVSNALSALEIEDLVTVRDVAVVAQRLEMVRRIADEVTGQVVELGTDGRLLALQLDELMAGVDADRDLIVRDYTPTGRKARLPSQVFTDLAALSATDLLDLTHVARSLGLSGTPEGLDSATSPRGHRLLARVPRMPGAILDRVVEHFGGLQKLLAASAEDLQVVDGVGETRARAVREAISRLAEISILDRYS
ncbi:DNA integrity scanning diadenylate cyclase DisA [Jatrophihabitans sp.]|uniref:DNA integrity scanning diadenylate cyclase DisA n=1 Tax=Jatrophihabitans sp. TaxID=1932789 RepID=UPI0030C6E79B|nr:integrity scanning protein DisA [Jatrophihabitans sp.]